MPETDRNTEAGKPKLSLVMIAKDEEANLPRAMKSAAGWVDEIILVDTGSTDRTVEIAKSFGAVVHRHSWQNNFALHRNQALSYATGDWCLQLDADEELDPSTARLIGQLILEPDVSAFDVEMVNIKPGGGHTSFRTPRLFRNAPGVCYERAVHNQLNRAALSARRECGVRIWHHGYAGDEKAMAKKHSRRMEMISAWTEREPGNWEAWFYLAQALTIPPLQEGQLAKAMSAGEKALALAAKDGIRPELYQVVYLPLIIALEGSQDFCGQLDLAVRWAGEQPGNPDAHFFRAASLFHLGDWLGLCAAARNYMSALQALPEYLAQAPPIELVSPARKSGLMVLWILAAARCGRAEEHAMVFARLMEEPDGEQACLKALKVLAQSGLAELAQELGGRMLQAHPDWEWCRRILEGSQADVAAAG